LPDGFAWRRRLPRHANAVWNGYLADTTDFGGLALLPLFVACRAAVRAKTSASAANLRTDRQGRSELQARSFCEATKSGST
jgi:aminoglycoside phosphotransferase family enzyme